MWYLAKSGDNFWSVAECIILEIFEITKNFYQKNDGSLYCNVEKVSVNMLISQSHPFKIVCYNK